jgi:hypothetical protein
MKKITTKIQLAVVIVALFFTSCSSDGTISYSGSSGYGGPDVSGHLFVPTATDWSVVDSSKWYGYRDENNFRYLRAKFKLPDFNNAKTLGFVARMDNADSVYAMPYIFEGYKAGLDSVAGELYIQNPDEDYSSFYPLSETLKFRVIFIPVDKLSSGVNINDYDAVCTFYNIEP